MIFKFKDINVPVDIINQSYLQRFVSIILDWRFRKATGLVAWLDDMVIACEQDERFITVANSIPDHTNPDQQALAVLKWVRDNIKYTGDKEVWDTDEYWQTAQETLGIFTGDCEDGAILMYVLCRMKAIPARRLLIFAGGVEGGGHCWLGYRPKEYPLNFVFLDWCYWYNSKSPDYRNIYYIHGQTIKGYKHNDEEVVGEDTNYKNIWFGFNEWNSYKRLDYDHTRRKL